MTLSGDDHKRPRWGSIGKFLLDWGKSLALFSIIVAAGTLLFLIGSSVVGYLPYSDRPGPGWERGVFGWTEVKFFLGWLPLLLYLLLYLGAALFPFARLLGYFHAPRSIVRVFGGLFAGTAGLIGVLASGWYIAISEYSAYAGAVCGIIYGAVLLPSESGTQGNPRNPRRTWKQWAATAATILACGMFIGYPLIPKQPEQSLEYVLVKIVPGPEDLAADYKRFGLTATEVNQLKSLGLTGTLRSGLHGVRGASSSVTARALIVFTEDLHSPVNLREPRGSHVIYVQQNGAWETYPPNTPTISRIIKLLPSAKGPQQIDMQDGSLPTSSFSWYPPNPR